MGSLKKNRKKRPGSGLQKHKRSIVAITAVIILLCGMVIVHGMALKKSNDAYKVQEEELQTQIDAEKERSEEINKLKKYVGTDEYIEEVAREKLGLVGPNERVYIDANCSVHSSNVRKALGRKYPEAFFIHRNLEGGGKWRLNTERSK